MEYNKKKKGILKMGKKNKQKASFIVTVKEKPKEEPTTKPTTNNNNTTTNKNLIFNVNLTQRHKYQLKTLFKFNKTILLINKSCKIIQDFLTKTIHMV